MFCGLGLGERAARLQPQRERIVDIEGAARTPYFCSGCPHNTSTRVPEGSQALAGIGCHFMASWMDRNTSSLIQMGGEGVNWVASSLFTGRPHVFQNLGEGTYYHSGSMAIRQAVAAKANITYKILFNDAVAMTGGQPVDGPISVQRIAHELNANGVGRIALVADDPDKFSARDFPAGVSIDHRSRLDAVQRELREIPGVTALIYEQECATERRRKRKRGQAADPAKFAYINELVCEGCGDCSVESNCLSIEPKETPFGRKRQVNLSSCNKDFSCINGFCPSFVTIEGGTRRKRGRSGQSELLVRAARLAAPSFGSLEKPFNLLVTGVGGTGVITVGTLIAMAAHLEGKGASVLDFTGFAQKFGPVLSVVRLSAQPETIHQVRIDHGAADALIGCDIVVSSWVKASTTFGPGMRAVLNMAEMPTGDVVRNRDAGLAAQTRKKGIEAVIGADNILSFDANHAADRLFGDTVFANVIMLGAAWQQGLVPVSLAALMRAIELNAVAIEENRLAFAAGRLIAADPAFAASLADTHAPETLDEMIARRVDFLTAYQDGRYAARYLSRIEQVRAAERGAEPRSETLTSTVAASLFKLMAYKDEYEVARLHRDASFRGRLAQEFEGDFTVKYHLAPPFLAFSRDARGRPLKMQFGAWVEVAFGLLARLRFLRGTAFDIFGYTRERKTERELIGWYEGLIEEVLTQLGSKPLASLVAIASLPADIRGYGGVKHAGIEAAKSRALAMMQALAF
jgi:indolepyruvate ferredoxin oxidoreductase